MMLDTDTMRIDALESLSDNASVLSFIRQALEDGQAAGDFPKENRPGPTGYEHASVIWERDTLIAFATFYYPHRSTAWLDLLWVHPSFRKRGLGQTLINHVLTTARRDGVAHLSFGTLASNTPMRHLAERTGFVQASVSYTRGVGD